MSKIMELVYVQADGWKTALQAEVTSMEQELAALKVDIERYVKITSDQESKLAALEAQEPVGYVAQSLRDGSIGCELAVVGWADFENRKAKMHKDPWVIKNLSRLAPLYLAAGAKKEPKP